jgi:hypothetical protein
MQRIAATEGQPLDVDEQTLSLVRSQVARLTRQLRPTLPFLTESGGTCTIWNLVGSVALGPTQQLDVAPKVAGNGDWVPAVLDLLGDGRTSITGTRQAGRSPYRPDLLDALAILYEQRLSEAIRLEGPLLMLHRYQQVGRRLNGKLDVTSWTRSSVLKPHLFPVTRDAFDADNDFTSAMSIVAIRLARVTRRTELAQRLTACARELRPGLQPREVVDPSVIQRPVPSQWRKYGPAWSIAVAVLSRSSLLQRSGSNLGVEVAIEAWPLLERLLERALTAAAKAADTEGRALAVEPKQRARLMTPILQAPPRRLSRLHGDTSVIPDGLLSEGGTPVASFEAKYATPNGSMALRPHVFQAVSTATAVNSPLAVLVYPERSEPVIWRAEAGGRPVHVAAVGLDLYSYRRGAGDVERGKVLLDLLKTAETLTS